MSHAGSELSLALGTCRFDKSRGLLLRDNQPVRQPLASVAHILARACGHIGSCAEYLYNTVSHLEAHGIHDRNLWQLQEMVAAEIVSLHSAAQIRSPSPTDSSLATHWTD
jgi:hypothetical protein